LVEGRRRSNIIMRVATLYSNAGCVTLIAAFVAHTVAPAAADPFATTRELEEVGDYELGSGAWPAPPTAPITSSPTVVMALAASGDVSDYSLTIILRIGATFATTANVSQDRVTVNVTAGSVTISVEIEMATHAEATAVIDALAPSLATPTAATVLLSTVSGINITVADVLMAPMIEQPAPPSSPPESIWDRKFLWALTLPTFIGIVAGGSIGVLLALVICCKCWTNRMNSPARAPLHQGVGALPVPRHSVEILAIKHGAHGVI